MLYTWIYKNLMKYAGVKGWGKLFQYLHAKFLKIKDPVIEYEIRGKKCMMPFSQMTPYYMKRYPNYDIPLKKICEYAKEKLNDTINIVDIGANIGDTVLDIDILKARYLLVEGTAKYSELIKDNLGSVYDYVLETTFLSDEADCTGGGYSVKINDGTASIWKDDENGNKKITFKTLDEVVSRYHFEPHIIKIDTDGFDFKVLRGSTQTLKQYMPILFFEWNIAELKKNENDVVSIFAMLHKFGYLQGYVFDNYGNLLTRVETDNKIALCLLAEYVMSARPRTIWYYDILLIHRDKNIDVESFIKTL